jgi:hypothetical protein
MRFPRSTRAGLDRRGYSLGELLLTLTITIGIFAAAVPFFTMQMRQLAQDVGRTDAQQTARYAQNMVDRELRNIGIGVQPMDPAQGIPRNQPKIIQAHAYSVTFNTDLVANDTSDVEAVYFDPNVPMSQTLAGTRKYDHAAILQQGYPDHIARATHRLAGRDGELLVSSVDRPERVEHVRAVAPRERRAHLGGGDGNPHRHRTAALQVQPRAGQRQVRLGRYVITPHLLGPGRQHRRFHSRRHAHRERCVQ